MSIRYLRLALIPVFVLAACGGQSTSDEEGEGIPVAPSNSTSLGGTWNHYEIEGLRGTFVFTGQRVRYSSSLYGCQTSIITGPWSLTADQLTIQPDSNYVRAYSEDAANYDAVCGSAMSPVQSSGGWTVTLRNRTASTFDLLQRSIRISSAGTSIDSTVERYTKQ